MGCGVGLYSADAGQGSHRPRSGFGDKTREFDDPIDATRQYSSGKSRVVADRSASVIIHSF